MPARKRKRDRPTPNELREGEALKTLVDQLSGRLRDDPEGFGASQEAHMQLVEAEEDLAKYVAEFKRPWTAKPSRRQAARQQSPEPPKDPQSEEKEALSGDDLSLVLGEEKGKEPPAVAAARALRIIEAKKLGPDSASVDQVSAWLDIIKGRPKKLKTGRPSNSISRSRPTGRIGRQKASRKRAHPYKKK